MRLPLAAPVAAALLLLAGHASGQAVSSEASLVAANDNRRSSGERSGDVLRVRLVVDTGRWQPEGPDGRTLLVQAFREEGRELTSPGPLVRVPAGTEIVVSIRNHLRERVSVFGFVTRPAMEAVKSLDVSPGETRETRFLAGVPGTYHYWATTTGRPLVARGDVDSQLNGAFVVDPPGAVPEDRVLVVSLWRKPGSVPGSVDIGAINGRSWPLTERLDYRLGETARWRVVNLSLDQHAMHLHGVFFHVLANSDGLQHSPYPMKDRPFVVGIRVAGASPPNVESAATPRRFALRLREEAGRYNDRPGYRIDAEGIEAARLSPGPRRVPF